MKKDRQSSGSNADSVHLTRDRNRAPVPDQISASTLVRPQRTAFRIAIAIYAIWLSYLIFVSFQVLRS